jgi:manganese efflux pump family protein
MSFTVIILLAIGLAMDAFAVSVTNGITIKNIRLKHALIISLFFGFFQAVMPVFGWLLGKGFNDIISTFDYWVVFFILLFIGLKMIYDSLKKSKNDLKAEQQSLNIYTIFMLAIATSIDAFAVGVGFSLIEMGIIFPSIIIGVITFILSFIGVYIGKKLGRLFGRKMEILGGLILIIIAFNVLLENVHVF